MSTKIFKGTFLLVVLFSLVLSACGGAATEAPAGEPMEEPMEEPTVAPTEEPMARSRPDWANC